MLKLLKSLVSSRPETGRCISCVDPHKRMPLELLRKEEEGVAWQECPGCHGLWVSGDTLDRLARSAPGSYKTMALRQLENLNEWKDEFPDRLWVSDCPGCEWRMHRILYNPISSLSFLRCERCPGIWITASQLARIRLHEIGFEGVLSSAVAQPAKPAKPAAPAKPVAPPLSDEEKEAKKKAALEKAAAAKAAREAAKAKKEGG